MEAECPTCPLAPLPLPTGGTPQTNVFDPREATARQISNSSGAARGESSPSEDLGHTADASLPQVEEERRQGTEAQHPDRVNRIEHNMGFSQGGEEIVDYDEEVSEDEEEATAPLSLPPPSTVSDPSEPAPLSDCDLSITVTPLISHQEALTR